MAQDLFAPRSAFQIGYEQPIQPAVDNTEKVRTDFEQMALRSEAKQIRAESTLENVEFAKQKAILDVVGTGLKAYGSYTQTSEAARKRQATGDLFQGLDDLQAQREAGTITEAKYEIEEDRLIKSAIRANVDMDSVKTELEIYTNKPVAMLGKKPEEYLQTQMRNDPRFVVYSNASRVTSPDLTDADHENYAFQQIQLEDRNQSIALMADAKRKATKGAAYINFDTEFKPTIDDRYNRLQASILATVETSSGNIDRKGLRDMLGVIKAENALLLNEKAYLGVSDEDFQPVLDRVQALEKFIQTTLDSNTPEVYWDDFRGAIADAARAGGNPDMLMGSMLMTDVPTVMSAYGVGRSTELLSSIMNSDAAKQYFTPISNGDTLREITDATTETVTPNTVLTDDQLPDAFKVPEGQQRSVTKSNYESGIFLLKTTDPNRLQEETFRKQFVTGATNVVRAMNTPDVAMSKQYITDAIVSTNMADMLDKLEIYDKTSADTLRIGIRSQLQHQSNVNGAYLDNLENSAAVLKGYPVRLSWDSEEQAYYITGTEGNPQGVLRHFKQIDPSYYKANFVEGKGLKADPSNTVFKNSVVTKALTARESIDFINNQMEVFKKDGVEDISIMEPSIESDIRSIRNNNPGNIDRTSTQWEGMAEEQTDSRFVTFESPEMGVRAMARTLNTYNTRYGLDDIAGMVSRWAPPNENDTQAYIRFVSEKTGIPSDRTITLQDNPEEMKKVISAMIEMEGGQEASRYFNSQIVGSGVDLALSSLGNRQEDPMQESEQITVSNIEGNVMARPDDESLASAWDILYSGTHDPETGQLIQGE